MSTTENLHSNETDGKELLDSVHVDLTGGESQYIGTNNGMLLPRMDSNGLLDVATAAGLYLTKGTEVLAPTEQFPPEEILSAQDLTEDDKRLAAALVAVQLVQQQKQQQLLLHDATAAANHSQVEDTSLAISEMGVEKVSVDEIQTAETLVMSYSNNRRVTSVPVRSASNFPTQNFRKIGHSRSKNKKSVTQRHTVNSHDDATARYTATALEQLQDILVKSEEDTLSDDSSDGLISDTSPIGGKSLPHKKRISQKLRNSPKKTNGSVTSSKSFSQQRQCSKCGHLLKGGKLSEERNFACQICEQIFSNQFNFFQHLKDHYEPNSIETSSQKTSDNTKMVKKTNISVMESSQQNGTITALKCLECGKSFRRQKTFDNHLREAHPKLNKLEMDEFSETEDLMEGIRVVVEDENETAIATTNEVNGPMQLTIQQDPHQHTLENIVLRTGANGGTTHILSNSNIIMGDTKVWYRVDDELHATVVDLQELEAEQLKEQQQQIQLDGAQSPHICQMCGAVFEQRLYLTQHIADCYLVLKQEAELLNSQATTSQDIDKIEQENLPEIKDVISLGGNTKKSRKKKTNLMCKICNRVFNHRNSLVYHLRSHTGDRPHQCDDCGKSFYATTALKVHKRLHTGDKPYKCDFCGRQFRQWGDLNYHRISIHSNQRQYQCEYCGKDFARKYSLVVHRRIHTGEKNYQCEYCKKTFRASSYLQNHRRIHTGEKPHPCEICGKPFRVRSDMKRHMNTHTRDRSTSKNINSSDIKQNNSSDSEQENGGDSSTPVQSRSPTPTKTKSSTEVVPKTELVGLKTDCTQEILQTPKEEDLSGTLYTVPGDPLTIREGNNTVYVWPVYMN